MNDALAAVVALMLVSAPAAMAQDQKSPKHGKEQAVERMFQRVDADKDGAIEAKESAAAWDKLFERMDANGDGVILRDEAVAEHGKREASEERRKRAEEWRAKRFLELDADGDGKVTKAEFQAKEQKVFGEADANGDGKVTKEEAAARMAQMRQLAPKK
jgi:Ca2+-binding EF-hand superfamily protein